MYVGQVIAAEVLRLRESRGWSRQQLAERLGELGAKTDRAVIARIESGGTRAKNLSVADLLVLAAALDTSPVSMVFPAGRVEMVEVTPQLRIFSGLASKWFCAEVPLTDEYQRPINHGEWIQATWGTRSYRESDRLSENVRASRRQVASAEYVGDQHEIKAAKAKHVEALRALERLYRELDRDEIAPPGETLETVNEWKAIGIKVPDHWLWESPEIPIDEGEPK